MMKEYFNYIYVVAIVVITVMVFVATHLFYTKSNVIESKLVTQNVGTTDGFHRLRISNPYTLGDYKHVYGNNPDMLDYLVSGGTNTHNANESSVKLAVTNTIGSRVVHQSKMYHHYMPGKSHIIMTTFVFKEHCKGISKRAGYFDDRNGVFFEEDEDGILNFVVRSYVTGAAKERVAKQNDWNGDKLNGKGSSGWIIDTTKSQLAWFDFQWLGVGRVRCGFIHENEYVLCHTFYNSDILDKVFMTNPNLPLRCEIVNISSKLSCNFDQICGTVISEGGYREAGYDFSSLTGPVAVNGSGDAGNEVDVNVITIRLKDAFKSIPNRMFARITGVTVFSSAEQVSYKVIKVSSATGTFSDYHTNSGIETATDGAPNSGATEEIMSTGTVPASTSGGGKNQTSVAGLGQGFIGNAKKNFIAQNYDSTDSEAIIVKVTNSLGSSNDTNVTVSLSWKEIY